MSHVEDEFKFQLRCLGLPVGESEYKFHPDRRWRFDIAWPDKMIAVEIEGGKYISRHRTMAGFEKDCEKYNTATDMGWQVYRYTTDMVKDGRAIEHFEWAWLQGA